MKTLILGFLSLIALFFSQKEPVQNKIIPNTLYRLIEMRDTFGTGSNFRFVYHHTFTYDEQGRPTTHILETNFHHSTKQFPTDTFFYMYDSNSGRLTEQYNKHLTYKYFYTPNGALNRITLAFSHGRKDSLAWVVYEETLIEEKPLPNNQTKLILTFNKLRSRPNKPDTVDLYNCTNYIKNESNNIISSERVVRDYVTLSSPMKLNYSYDNKPNPMQQLYLERMYEFDLDNRGLTNVTSKKTDDGHDATRTYEYNQFGYPALCKFGTHTQYYRYEQVPVKTQITQKKKEDIKVPENNTSDIQLSLYPNPATTEVNIKASGLGDGKAIVRIVDLKGNLYKAVTYNVNDLLEALIPIGGLAKGVYVLEISSAKGIVSKQLLVR